MLFSEVSVFLAKNPHFRSYFIDELTVFQFQLLYLFIFLAVEVGKLNLQLFYPETLPHLCFTLLIYKSL
jgi:hypothetical protein